MMLVTLPSNDTKLKYPRKHQIKNVRKKLPAEYQHEDIFLKRKRGEVDLAPAFN